MSDKYLVDLISLNADGSERDVKPTTVSEGVHVGEVTAGSLELPGASSEETLDETIGKIKAALTNLKNISSKARNVSSDYATTNTNDIATMKSVADIKASLDALVADLASNSITNIKRAPVNHASTATTYGAGNASNYGHVKVSDTYKSATSGANAAGSIAASQNALANAYAALDAAKASKEHTSSTTTYGGGTASLFGHVKLSDTYDSVIENAAANNGVAASQNALANAYAALNTRVTTNETNISGKAPKSHASSGTTYGAGTGSNYGHVKLSDTYNSAVSSGAAANGLAASQNALFNAYNALNGSIGGKLASSHASEKATDEKFSHVKLVDSYSDDTNAASTGIAPSAKALSDAYTALNTAIGTKAPTSHASTGTGYGLGTGSNYGHVKLSDTYNSAVSNAAAANGIAASQNALYNAYNALNGAKAPKAHASSSTTYGIGTATNYGHVKLVDSYTNTSAASTGIVPSAKALSDAVTALSNSITSLQNSISALNSTATSEKAGLMAAEDKTKLDGISSGANKYVHSTSSGNKHIPAGGSSGQILRWSADGTAVWGNDNNTTYSNMTAATSSAAGKAGLVPAPSVGAQGKFLRGDGTWVAPLQTVSSTISAYVTADTHILKLGYWTCTANSYDNLVLLISSSFWGNQHGSSDIIALRQDTNNNSTGTVQCTLNRTALSTNNENRIFYYKKDNDNKRVYIYVKVLGGNGYGSWISSVIHSIGGKWVTEYKGNQTLESSFIEIGEIYSRKTHTHTIDTALSSTSTNPLQNKVVYTEINNLKKSVSDGKTAVANAITGKGVTTAADATFATMATNITTMGTNQYNAGVSATKKGTAVAADVLSGKTFTNSSGVAISGGMTNNGAKTAELAAGGSYTIPKGYHNGSGKITAKSLASQTDGTATASQILSGQTAYVDGVKVTGTMPNLSANSNITHATGNGTKVVLGDAAFLSTNTDNVSRAEIRYTGENGVIIGNTLLAVPVETMRDAINTGVNASSGQILSGYSAWNGRTLVNGSMTNQGAKTASLNCGGSYTIPAGYHNGSGKVTANSLASQTSATATAADITKGKTAYVNGSKITGTSNKICSGKGSGTIGAGNTYFWYIPVVVKYDESVSGYDPIYSVIVKTSTGVLVLNTAGYRYMDDTFVSLDNGQSWINTGGAVEVSSHSWSGEGANTTINFSISIEKSSSYTSYFQQGTTYTYHYFAE